MKNGCDKEGAADERWLKKHDTKYKKKKKTVTCQIKAHLLEQAVEWKWQK